jgi:hypothetical protein
MTNHRGFVTRPMLCRDSRAVEHEFRIDQDDSLQSHQEEILDRRYLPAMVAALQLAGVPIEATTP